MNSAKLKRHEKELARKFRAACVKGGSRGWNTAARNYINSHAARFVAAEEAVRTCKRRSHKSAEAIAKDLNVWRSCDEVAHVGVKIAEELPPPGQGGMTEYRARVVLSFGPENQARQILLRNLFKAMPGKHASQMMFNGGTTRAVRLVEDCYVDGYQHSMEVDIYRCFQSFDKQGISAFLRLPEKVTEHVLGASSLNLRPSLTCMKDVLYHSPNLSMSPMELFMELFGEDWDLTQLGLIEGSKASPFAAELLLAPICDDLAKRGAGRVINYADNFLLMAKSKSELTKLYNLLREGLHTHPAGPLQVKETPKRTRPQESFEFLGYKFLPNGESLQCTWAKKSETKAKRIRREGHRLLSSNMPNIQKCGIYKDVCKKHRELVAAFPMWPENMEFHETKMRALKRHIARQRLRTIRN